MKDGPLLELEAAVLWSVHLGAGQVRGQEIRRELDAGEVEAQDGGQGAHQHRFAEAGQPFQQHVPVGQRRHRMAPHPEALVQPGNLEEQQRDEPPAVERELLHRVVDLIGHVQVR